jgi:hypothetical protein
MPPSSACTKANAMIATAATAQLISAAGPAATSASFAL